MGVPFPGQVTHSDPGNRDLRKSVRTGRAGLCDPCGCPPTQHSLCDFQESPAWISCFCEKQWIIGSQLIKLIWVVWTVSERFNALLKRVDLERTLVSKIGQWLIDNTKMLIDNTHMRCFH